MKILLTGGTGFIGSHFLGAALAAGHEVIALRRPGREARVPLRHQPAWREEGWAALPEEAFAGVDALVHLAAAGVSPQRATIAELFECNVTASLRLWERAATVPHFLICGSCFEYGRSAARYDFIPPDAPLEPVNAYGASKAAATIAAVALARERKLRISILRPFHVFGEGQHEENFWPALRRAAQAGEDFRMTPGEQLRDFVPAEAVAAQFLAALDAPPSPGEPRIANVGSGTPATLRAFAEHWWREWKATGVLRFDALPYRADEVMRYVPLLP